MIIPSTPHNGIIITIIGAIISTPFFIWAFLLYKDPGQSIKSLFPQRRRQGMIIVIGAVLMIVGFGLIVSQLDFHKEVSPPTSEPTLPGMPTFIDASKIDPSQELDFEFGTNHMIYKWSDFESNAGTPMIPVSLNGLVPFRPHTFGGKLYVDISVYGGKDSTPISIKDNVATVIPSDWDKNQDDYAYEVVNENGDPIFQLIYVSQFHIVVNGIFPFPGGLVWASKSGMEINPSPFKVFHLDPIFKYPSSEYLGQRVIPLVFDKEDSRTR